MIPATLPTANSSPADAGVLLSLPVNSWRPSVDAAMQARAVAALERGQALYLPNLSFTLSAEEKTYQRPDSVRAGTKSVKYSPVTQSLWGASEQDAESPVLKALLQRYVESAASLMSALLPGYAAQLVPGNASFRPVEAMGREQSKRHDDRRLHVDAFPSRPTYGKRILRVFTNVHPGGAPRVWRVGEPFADVAARFMPQIRPPLPWSAEVLDMLHITKGPRSPYDHYMMHLHDRMKLDDAYQQTVQATTVEFPPGSSWIVFSDQVSHAAMAGCHLMEQTSLLPVSAMSEPPRSPLRVLEAIKGRRLV